MNYLLVYAHPNPKSFCHAIKEDIVIRIKQQGGEVVVRDIYQLGFDSVLSSNDFVQYMLAVDRTNEKISDLYVPHHPSVLRGLKKVVAAANKHKIGVSICGDMVHDERYLRFLIGIGLRQFSLNPDYIPRIQKAISRIDLVSAQNEAKKLLQMTQLKDIDGHYQ